MLSVSAGCCKVDWQLHISHLLSPENTDLQGWLRQRWGAAREAPGCWRGVASRAWGIAEPALNVLVMS